MQIKCCTGDNGLCSCGRSMAFSRLNSVSLGNSKLRTFPFSNCIRSLIFFHETWKVFFFFGGKWRGYWFSKDSSEYPIKVKSFLVTSQKCFQECLCDSEERRKVVSKSRFLIRQKWEIGVHIFESEDVKEWDTVHSKQSHKSQLFRSFSCYQIFLVSQRLVRKDDAVLCNYHPSWNTRVLTLL